eukprot:CAMPEP_0168626660 /NCGR_PEP_ID=MMETSP0449_2-20121227/10761_1 /TAXON_ID=1082188 /ORGANISM="Strombidium rassoulzadegani, Strain ras09" /LENGTH=103 /DNA_ID=CAMNT_0008668691 /DNA_START=432 /DNA_END=741 /DNA_ORIENTATION=+
MADPGFFEAPEFLSVPSLGIGDLLVLELVLFDLLLDAFKALGVEVLGGRGGRGVEVGEGLVGGGWLEGAGVEAGGLELLVVLELLERLVLLGLDALVLEVSPL